MSKMCRVLRMIRAKKVFLFSVAFMVMVLCMALFNPLRFPAVFGIHASSRIREDGLVGVFAF